MHTLPDWTTSYRMVKVFASLDNNELAARLGSIDTFDRRGNVYWFEDFEGSSLSWKTTTHIDGGTIALVNTYPHRGSQCCKITTVATAERWGRIVKYFAYPLSDRIGFEVWFSTEALKGEIEGFFEIDNGTNVYTCMWLINIEDKTVKIWTTTGWETIATLAEAFTRDYSMYNVIKVVVDMSTRKYVRLLLNNVQYNTVTAHSMPGGATGGYARIHTWLEYTTKAAAANSCQFDNFIYTFNEP